MKLNKILIYGFTLVMVLLVAVLFYISTDANSTSLFTVICDIDGREEELKCFEAQKDELYVFLPGYADMSDLSVNIDSRNEFKLDSVELKDGMSFGSFETDKTYDLKYTYFATNHSKKITFVKCGNLSSMHIDTQSKSMDKIHAKKENSEPAQLRVYTADGGLNYEGAIEKIGGRGNYTWNLFQKKPYSLTLTQPADLLDMGGAMKWVLIANADDESSIRDKFIYDLADNTGLKFSPDTRWVDLYLNGEYAGLYLLSEKVEIHPERVNIEEDGSFLVSLEQEDRLLKQQYTHIVTDNSQALRVHSPQVVSDEYLLELKDTFQSIENAVMADNGVDPITGCHFSELIDIDSWARKYLIEEISGNWDGGFISQYFYYDINDETGKVYAAPVWDYGLSMGNPSHWGTQNPNIMYSNQLDIRANGSDALWFHYLYEKDEFLDRVKQLYKEEFLSKTTQMLEVELENYAESIAQSHTTNSIRWKLEEKDAFEHSEQVRQFMTERLRFLSRIWVEEIPYHTVTVKHTGNAHYIVFQGECLPLLPEIANTNDAEFLYWYYEESGEPVDYSKIVTEDISICSKLKVTKSEMMNEALKVAPCFVILILFAGLIFIEIRRNRKR